MRTTLSVLLLASAAVVVACSPVGNHNSDTDWGTVWIIGDSIAVAAGDDLETAIPGVVVNAEEGRQFRHGPPTVVEMLAESPPPDVLIVALGTNGPIDDTHVDEIATLAGNAELIFVNVHVPRDWEDQVNATLVVASERHGATIIDWKAVAVTDDSLLRSDGYHPSSAGLEVWSRIIADALGA